MVEKLKLQDFDILGILELKDIQGIEKFVTPIKVMKIIGVSLIIILLLGVTVVIKYGRKIKVARF